MILCEWPVWSAGTGKPRHMSDLATSSCCPVSSRFTVRVVFKGPVHDCVCELRAVKVSTTSGNVDDMGMPNFSWKKYISSGRGHQTETVGE